MTLALISTTSERRRALTAAVVLSAPLVLGLCMQANENRAALCGIAGPTCPIGAVLGPTVCPGCGLTRSTALILHGDWAAATAVHPGGWIIVLLCAAGALLYADVARRGARTTTHDRLLRAGRVAFLTGIASTWLARWTASA